MTIQQELREWVEEDVGIAWLTDEAWIALNAYMDWDVNRETIQRLEWYDRRTFALLVAEALDGETS